MVTELAQILPEIALFSAICVILIASLFVSEDWRHRFVYGGSQFALVLAFILLLKSGPQSSEVIFSGHIISDGLSFVLKVGILVIAFLGLLYTYYGLADSDVQHTEYYLLCLFSVLGMMLLVSSHSFLSLYLGIELLSLPLYGLVAINRNDIASSEAAMKYFILGALASGILLYGMSLIYGATQSIEFSEIAAAAAVQLPAYGLVISLGLIFLIVGFAFKLGAAPFHMWVPDVYQGAITPVTLFISTAPKIAAAGMTIRILHDALPSLSLEWQSMLLFVALFSIIIGNIIAISQTDIKRLLAYSGIAHIGFMLIGLVSGSDQGLSSAVFYIIVYTLTTAGGFGLLIVLNQGEQPIESLEDLKGLHSRNPWYAFMMLILVFSMAGVPPTVGFYAKFAVFQAAVASGFMITAIVGVLFSVIGAYYYLRVIKYMYFDSPTNPAKISAPMGCSVVTTCNGLLVLLLGILPSALIGFCAQVIGS